jgi:hypothetical protein
MVRLLGSAGPTTIISLSHCPVLLRPEGFSRVRGTNQTEYTSHDIAVSRGNEE